MLFTTAGAEGYISGVILFDETIRQQGSDGRPLVQVLEAAGVIPGIKVDKGTTPLARAPGELVTDGLDGLRARLVEYRELGAKFAKWRAVIDIGDGIPSSYCIAVNAHTLARYAALCQDEGIVPIVEPEVLMDGDHSLERCSEVTTAHAPRGVRRADGAARAARRDAAQAQHGDSRQEAQCRQGLTASGRASDGRVLPATSCPRRCPASCSCRVGRATRRRRPTSTRSTSSDRTRGMCRSRTGARSRPPRWPPGRATTANAGAGQKAFLHRARMNGLARDGKWTPDTEKAS